MDFIFIQALWLLPIASLPIIFNIINNKKFKVVDFSTIRFIESLKSDSIKKVNLLNLILLILRILIILMLILAISRPVINSKSKTLFNSDTSTKVVILIDDSYSNFNKEISGKQSDKVGVILQEVAAQYGSATSIEVASINQGILYAGEVEGVNLKELDKLSSYKNGNMWNLMDSYFSNNDSNSYLNGDMYVLTDMDRSSFRGIDKQDWWNIVFINTASIIKKPSIGEINLSKKIISPDQSFNVTLKIVNGSNVEYLQDDDLLTAYLYIGEDISVPQSFGIGANSIKEIEFKEISDVENGILSASLSRGNEEFGSRVFAKANMAPSMAVGFLNIEDSDTRMFLSKAMTSIQKNRVSTGEAFLNYSSLTNYDIVILDKIKDLESPDLVKYTEEGGHVIVFHDSSDISSYSVLLGRQSIALKYQEDGCFVNKEDILDPILKNEVFDRNNENIVFELTKFHSLPLNSNSIIKNNNTSIWNRYSINQGIVDIFGFNLNLKNNNFSIQASFIPFIYNLLILSKNKEVNVEICDDLIDQVFVSKETFPLILKKDSTLVEVFDFYTQKIDLSSIRSPGCYRLVAQNDSNKIIKTYVANVDPLEIEYKEIEYSEIDSLFNDNMYRYDAKDGDFSSLGEAISRKIKGVEIWYIFLMIAISLFIVESFIVGNYQRRF